MWLSWVPSRNYKAVIEVLVKAVISSETMAMEASTFNVAHVVVGRT